MQVSNIFTSRKFSWSSAKFTLPEALDDGKSKAFELDIPVSNNWDDAEKKLVIVCEHIDSRDLKARRMCDEFFGGLLSNLLAAASKYANLTVNAGRVSDYGIAVVPFQTFKTYHLDHKRQAIADKHFCERTEKILGKLEPTHVLVFGDTAAKLMFPTIEDHVYKRGWGHRYKRSWGTFVGVHTVDPADLVSVQVGSDQDDDDDDDGEEEGGRDLYSKTNLLGQVSRDMATVMTYGLTKDPHGLQFSVHGVSGKPVLVDTIKKFDRLMDELEDAECFAYDTETRNLNRIANKLLVMQFALDSDRGFVVPYLHRQTPFDKKELEHIRARVYQLLCNPNVDPFGDRYIIGTNLQFDLTQTKQQLRIPFISWPLFDIQYGDFIFDENISELDNFAGNASKSWSLMAISTRMGSSLFLDKEGFNKADRANMEASDLEDEGTLDYMAYDVTLPMAIHKEQRRRSEVTKYDKYMGMMLGQQSNNIHVAAGMEQIGVYLDTPYLEKQMRKGSDLHRILDEAKEQLYDTESAKQANDMLAGIKGVSLEGGGLFGEEDETIKVQIFNIDKPEHKQILFADVMDLEPVSGFGKKDRKSGTQTMTLDKHWQSEHREVYEVALYTRINKVAKLLSSYITSFHEKVTDSDDGKVDGRLRPSFGFLYVKTGRGNSFKPSLQQTPTRTKEAKYVKRMFSSEFGRLKFKTDFSANEVRFAANIAEDDVMAAPFNVARDLKKKLFDLSVQLAEVVVKHASKPSAKLAARKEELSAEIAEVRKELKTKGDIHIQNVFRFFGKWVAKSDPLRDAIKAVVFGVIYGKSAGTLGRDMWSQKVFELKNQAFELRKQIKALEAEMA